MFSFFKFTKDENAEIGQELNDLIENWNAHVGHIVHDDPLSDVLVVTGDCAPLTMSDKIDLTIVANRVAGVKRAS